jgi:GNAT superfamily N-acetyltransferase
MTAAVKPVLSRRDLRTFVFLPRKIHQAHQNWVPPVWRDDLRFFDRRKNRAFEESAAVLALAYKETSPVGRIMGIINHRYNRHRNEKSARFGFLECTNDQEVAHALLHHVETWARQAGLEKIVGPMGFSDQDPEGFLIEGFDRPPALASYCNEEYVLRLLEREGYEKEVDYVVYKLELPLEIPESYRKACQRISRRHDYRLVEFQTRKQLKSYILPVFELMNSCFKDVYGYLPLNRKEMVSLAKRYLPLIDARFIKIVVKGEDAVAFIIGLPNLSDGIRRARGRLFPTGIFKILRSAKRTKQLDLLLGGIREDCRGRGLDALMGCRIIEEARKAGFEYIDSHHELETNLRMRAEMERLGGRVYKRFRIYQKRLAGRDDRPEGGKTQ